MEWQLRVERKGRGGGGNQTKGKEACVVLR